MMPDIFSKKVRSHVMATIKKTDSKPEMIVRKYLHKSGLRYRKNVKALSGCPDIVLKKYRVIIFVNGCFWHAHANCMLNKPPKTNIDYWIPKIQRNKERDIVNKKLLKKSNWKVITVWECQLLGKRGSTILNNLYQKIIYKN